MMAAVVSLGVLTGSALALAGEADAHQPAAMQHEQGFIAIKGIEDEYSVIFHIMQAPQGASFSHDEYHLMVSIEKDGKALRGLPVRSTVRHPNGEIDELADMPQLGDWYMARYNLNHEQGRHHIFVDFKVSGTNYSADVYYPEIDFSEK